MDRLYSFNIILENTYASEGIEKTDGQQPYMSGWDSKQNTTRDTARLSTHKSQKDRCQAGVKSVVHEIYPHRRSIQEM